MLKSGTEEPSIKAYSLIQKLVDEYHQGSELTRSRLFRLAGIREFAVQAAGRFGYEVVNADRLQEVNPPGGYKGQVIYFSIYPENTIIRRHLGAGGMAVFIREGKVLTANGCRARTIVKSITTHNINRANQLEDALAAVAGLMALGMQPEELWRKRCL